MRKVQPFCSLLARILESSLGRDCSYGVRGKKLAAVDGKKVLGKSTTT